MKLLIGICVFLILFSCDDNYTSSAKFKELSNSTGFEHYYSLSCFDSESNDIFSVTIDISNEVIDLEQSKEVPLGIEIQIDSINSSMRRLTFKLHELKSVHEGIFRAKVNEKEDFFPSKKFGCGIISEFVLIVHYEEGKPYFIRTPKIDSVVLRAVFDRNRYPNIKGGNGYCLESKRDSRASSSRIVWY